MKGNNIMERKVLVESSARHVHLSQQDVEALFGKGATLIFKRALSQPGQFQSEQRVDLVGPKNTIKNVAILGPERKNTQVELSYTDARNLGITVPLRESGDTAGSTGLTLVGPVGSIDIPEGAIAAKRHIHITPDEAAEYGIENGQIVSVKVEGERGIVFDNVVVRVNPNFKKAMHIDTDEANAIGYCGETYGDIL